MSRREVLKRYVIAKTAKQAVAMTGAVKRLLVPPSRGLSPQVTGGFLRFYHFVDGIAD